MLIIDNLSVSYPSRSGRVDVLRGFSLQVSPGESLGVVGESGCGKSTAFEAAMRLLPGHALVSARRLAFDGVDLLRASEEELTKIRGRRMSMIFQDSTAALNPYLTIGTQLIEVVQIHEDVSRAAARRAAEAALELVQIPSPGTALKRHPHEFSGGQRQRISIALALAGGARLIIADEPTTALDPLLQLQMIDLLRRLQQSKGLSLVFISHDLSVIRRIANRVAVVYAGRVVEQGPADRFFCEGPAHPYAAALLASMPALRGPRVDRLTTIPGAPPLPGTHAAGCAFAPRCRFVTEQCTSGDPPTVMDADRSFECHHPVGMP